MLWIILAIISTFLMCMIFKNESIATKIGCTSWILVIFGMVCVSTSILCERTIDDGGRTYYVTDDRILTFLHHNIPTDEQFYIVYSGGADPYYTYAIETLHGYSIKTIDADTCSIRYISGGGHIETHEYTYNNWFINFIAFPIGSYRVIYVPENGIVTNHSLTMF